MEGVDVSQSPQFRNSSPGAPPCFNPYKASGGLSGFANSSGLDCTVHGRS